jgi:hypothetical protein
MRYLVVVSATGDVISASPKTGAVRPSEPGLERPMEYMGDPLPQAHPVAADGQQVLEIVIDERLLTGPLEETMTKLQEAVQSHFERPD